MAACSLAFTAPDYSDCIQQKLQLNSPGVLSNICHVLCIFLSVELNWGEQGTEQNVEMLDDGVWDRGDEVK